MKNLSIALLFVFALFFTGAAQNSQCIFMGTVTLHNEVFGPPCSAEPPIIVLLNNDGAILHTADYNPYNQTYGVSAFSSDGLHDSDRVWFRIIYNCDTVIARTYGDLPIFIGTPHPAPPEPREVHLTTNRTPAFTATENDTISEDFLYELQLHVFDPDSDEVLFSFVNAPDWLSINNETGLISGIPGAGDAGIYDITVIANDGYFRGIDTLTYTLTVLHTNHIPSSFHLLTPVNLDTIEYVPSDSVTFSWQRSLDADAGDIVGYQLVIVNLTLDTIRVSTLDTVVNLSMMELEPFMLYAWSVFSSDGIETIAASDTFFFGTAPPDNVKELPGIPSAFSLNQNYPNPFNPSTTIQFSIIAQASVTLTLYDIYGREVTTLVNENLPAGTYSALWDASNIAAGVYYYRITAGSFVETKRMLLLK